MVLVNFRWKKWTEPIRWARQSHDFLSQLPLGGPVVKMWFFHLAPIPLLSVLIYSNRSQNVILKVSWKKIEQNLTVGCVNIELFPANKMPCLHATSAIFANARAHTYGAFQVCKNVLIDSWNKHVKFRGMVWTPSASLGLLKASDTMVCGQGNFRKGGTSRYL